MLSPWLLEEIRMAAATLTEKGQIIIPAEIRARYELTPGTQVEFVDEGGVIRLLIRRRVPASDPAAGFGLVKVKPARSGTRRLMEFDVADHLKRERRKA
jgi:antitoxin PrlF